MMTIVRTAVPDWSGMSDLINRQDAINELYKINPSEDMLFIDAIVDMLENLPENSEQKWISVTEALPKVRTDVLLAFEKNMAVGFYSHGCWNVNTGNGFYTGVFTDEDKPIAWMPLPEPWENNNE